MGFNTGCLGKVNFDMKQAYKLSNQELIAIEKGINFLRLEHRSEWGIMDGEKHLKVSFARPVLKRPLDSRVADFCLAWAKHHPRHWLVEVTAHFFDGILNYNETIELEAEAKLDWLTDAVKTAMEDVKGSGNPKHLIGTSWKARIKTRAEKNNKG